MSYRQEKILRRVLAVSYRQESPFLFGRRKHNRRCKIQDSKKMADHAKTGNGADNDSDTDNGQRTKDK